MQKAWWANALSLKNQCTLSSISVSLKTSVLSSKSMIDDQDNTDELVTMDWKNCGLSSENESEMTWDELMR